MEDNTEIVELKIIIEKDLFDELQKLGDYLFFWDDEKEQKFEVEEIIQTAIDKYIEYFFKPHPKIDDWLIGKVNDKNFTLKNRFKIVLKKKSENQVWLRDMTGLPKSTISQILSNNHEVSLRHFLLIWRSLGCPPLEKVLYFDNK
jgi:hypothetical protein